MKDIKGKQFVVYYRVSTQKQGRSGLGLEAQKTMCENYINNIPNTKIINEFKEVESGKNNNRPQLTKAIELCKSTKATLVVAKLDRLSREVKFIFELRDSKIDFICTDLPEFNTLTLGIFATIAQYERELTSQRTISALAEKKKQGVKLGNPHNLINNLDKLTSFYTLNSNKNYIIENLILAFEKGIIKILDNGDLTFELDNFSCTWNASSRTLKYAGRSGVHDDRVMSLAFAYEAARRNTNTGKLSYTVVNLPSRSR